MKHYLYATFFLLFWVFGPPGLAWFSELLTNRRDRLEWALGVLEGEAPGDDLADGAPAAGADVLDEGAAAHARGGGKWHHDGQENKVEPEQIEALRRQEAGR